MKPIHASVQLIALHAIDVPFPCAAPWEAMQGDGPVRHCGDCGKDVFNLTPMTEQEAAELVAGSDGEMCVRFYRRQDGTVSTSDCSTNPKANQRRVLGKVKKSTGLQ